ATIKPAICRTILSSRDWPSEGSAMISLRRRMMMRSAGSEVDSLGLSPPRFCIGDLPRFPLAYSVHLATMGDHGRGPPSIAALKVPGLAGRRPAGSPASVLAQVVEAVQRPHRQLSINRIDQDADLNLRRGYGEDIDAALGQGLEHLGGDTGVAAHADADHGDLGHVGGTFHLKIADLLLGPAQDLECSVEVRALHGKGHVSMLAVREVFWTIMST